MFCYYYQTNKIQWTCFPCVQITVVKISTQFENLFLLPSKDRSAHRKKV